MESVTNQTSSISIGYRKFNNLKVTDTELERNRVVIRYEWLCKPMRKGSIYVGHLKMADLTYLNYSLYFIYKLILI